MLLAGLKRQGEDPLTVGVLGLAGDAAGKVPDVLVLAGHEADKGAAEGDRVAELVGLADHDVRAVAAGSLEEAERDGIGHDDQEAARGVDQLADGMGFLERAQEVGHLEDDAGRLSIDQIR
ncbi:hypothetical protein D3C86_688360 [compost metagenome]